MFELNLDRPFPIVHENHRDPIVHAFAVEPPINHQNPSSITRELALVQSKKSCVDRGDGSVAFRYRRCRFDADRPIERVMDIQPDFREIEAEEIYFDGIVAELSIGQRVFDAWMDGLEILG
jgi:hypothetical protein